MSDELSQLNNPADIDLSTVDTSFPILAAGVAAFTIQEVKDEQSDEGKPYKTVKYGLAQDWKTQPHDGIESKPVAPGFPITERIYLSPWTDPKTGEVKNFGVTRLAQLREAVFGKAAPGTRFNNEELIGQSITLKLKFDPAPKNKKTGETYGPQTSVDGYVRKAK